jgi:hypothetical protein
VITFTRFPCFSPGVVLDGISNGRRAILSSLKGLPETGDALDIGMEPPQRMLAALRKTGIGTH